MKSWEEETLGMQLSGGEGVALIINVWVRLLCTLSTHFVRSHPHHSLRGRGGDHFLVLFLGSKDEFWKLKKIVKTWD